MNSVARQMETRHFRTLFISDVHLGSKAAKTDYLLDFLRHHDADTIILVGDIIDGWRLRRNWYWPQGCNDVVQKLLRKARKGARIIYIPGNHDEFLREFPGSHFGGIEVAERMVHEAADGKKYLIIHGDEFDVVVRNARLLAYLGDWAYDAAIAINVILAAVRRRIGLPYWSFSAWAKLQVKHAVNFIGEFQRVVVDEAKRNDVDGVICGHIHHAVISEMDGIRYINTGDWVESCTAIAENEDGSFELITWMQAEENPENIEQEEQIALPPFPMRAA
ncbi:UDP-2,3-diacylglucosamine diphosphatase [Rhizobium sp. CG4]|jgi:UDP-2,3-diacylglucosamine pyrophosphatase LpxH|uniref:UDP-2,3-diacylglucosamine diphosphatase n=1 Tax=Rhizobium/Agrobacterium group TaxID=227290 RepID=UPI001783B8C8|nr:MULTISPECIES: UDP-2,3-diacylglucosamine diphosphatase [Rhizobium/Agrobacterium group]MBD9386827.1 UDP-2,3-diacylglucosamine diphosphatase [Agrobacterium sp. AGB01]MCM2455037.1 UDP-2,3-diacylglucosamine diphosphatase [Rhizobium sp. CG4]MCS4241329.1 UDP-2,3-diacylglucosamine pyrophosphatase LpxH [Rhizobium sp. BIGb0125]MDO5895394.1 UDP-2,3-diacylglucosamine diphosphatase [Agrobacterium sp. Azo12]